MTRCIAPLGRLLISRMISCWRSVSGLRRADLLRVCSWIHRRFIADSSRPVSIRFGAHGEQGLRDVGVATSRLSQMVKKSLVWVMRRSLAAPCYEKSLLLLEASGTHKVAERPKRREAVPAHVTGETVNRLAT